MPIPDSIVPFPPYNNTNDDDDGGDDGEDDGVIVGFHSEIEDDVEDAPLTAMDVDGEPEAAPETAQEIEMPDGFDPSKHGPFKPRMNG